MKIKTKILIYTFLPILFLITLVISYLIYTEKKNSKEAIKNLESSYISVQQQRLKDLMELTKNSIKDLYDNDMEDRAKLQDEAKKRLRNMFYDKDGYVFVFDRNGTNLVHPQNPSLEGKNLINLKDKDGVYIVKELIEKAKGGGGFVRYVWLKTTKNNKEVPKLSYAIYLEKWDWMMGTGIYIDDIDDYINVIKEKQSALLKKNIYVLVGISILTLIAVFVVLNFVINKIIGSLNLVVDDLKLIAEGEGDLTNKINVESKDEIGTLAKYFNQFVMKLREIIQYVKDNSTSLASSTAELSATTEELLRTSSDQASQVTAVASAVAELEATSQGILTAIKESDNLSKSAVSSTKEGKLIVDRLIEEINDLKHKMDTLNDTIRNLSSSSSEIGNILNTINDIADQTNLLALNAAIEAARAGEHGRGFAVVADEVRKLAEKTQNSTKEIESIVKSVQNETNLSEKNMMESIETIENSLKTMAETNTKFEQIMKMVEEVANKNASIGISTEEQFKAIEDISRSIQSISAGIEESSKAVEEVANTIMSIDKESADLQQIVKKFKT